MTEERSSLLKRIFSDDPMRVIYSLALFGGIFITFLLAFYIYWFAIKNGMTLSTEPNNWAIFGNYFGGVLAPILSFLTLIAILINMKLQLKNEDINRFEKMFYLNLEKFEDFLKINEENIYGREKIIREYFERTSKFYHFPSSDRLSFNQFRDDIKLTINMARTQELFSLFFKHFLFLYILIHENSDKKLYFKILQSSFPNQLLNVLFICVLSSENKELYENLEKSGFFFHLDTGFDIWKTLWENDEKYLKYVEYLCFIKQKMPNYDELITILKD